MSDTFKAYLHVKDMTGKTVKSIGLSNLGERYVETVMMGLLRNMNTERFYVDDSEVDAARKAVEGR